MKRFKVIALVEARVVTGPAKNILRFAAECRDKVDLTIVTFLRDSVKNPGAGSNDQFVTAARSKNIPMEIIRETGRFDLSVLNSLREILDRHKPDIVQTHAVKSHFLISLFRSRRPRWIAFHHGHTSEDIKMCIFNQFDRWSLKASDVVVTVCTKFATKLTRQGVREDRIFVVPNSVEHDFVHSDAKLSAETRKRFKVSDDELVILAVGRLSPEKGHRYLIDAISQVISWAPHLKLKVLIAGAGPMELKLTNQIAKRNLEQCVKLIGHCSDVRPLFSIADLFVLPSLSEGSPNVLLESMASCVPIVATNVGGVPEIVKDRASAILTPPASANLLGESIIELLEDRSLAKQLACVAFDNARLLFSPTKYDERILNIYDKAVRFQLD